MDKLGGGYSREGYHQLEREFDRQRAEEIYEQQKAENIKTAKKVAIGGAILTSVAGLSIGGAIVGNKISEKNLAEASSTVDIYNNNHLLEDQYSNLMVSFARDIKYIENIENKDGFIEIIECSKKIDELNLSQYPDVTCFDDTIEYVGPSEVERLIEEYEEAKNNLKYSNLVGDDIITFNHQVYELKELDKIYDSKVFEGCGYFEDYGEITTKLYLADIYGGKPDQYTVNSDNYKTSEYPEITGPGINYHDGFDSDLLEYARIINDIKKTKNIDKNFIYGTINSYTVNGANVINDIQKQRNKEIEESQKQYKEFSEMNKSK